MSKGPAASLPFSFWRVLQVSAVALLIFTALGSVLDAAGIAPEVAPAAAGSVNFSSGHAHDDTRASERKSPLKEQGRRISQREDALVPYTQQQLTPSHAPAPHAEQKGDTRKGGGAALSSSELPLQLAIPRVALTTTIRNPSSIEVDDLDAALQRGAVRYPLSARVGERGTMIIFGHSSGRPVVLNPAYKLFNRLPEVPIGAEVVVRSAHWEELYRVVGVRRVKVEGTRIALDGGRRGKALVLVTCPTSVASKEERVVVVAHFVGRTPRAPVSASAATIARPPLVSRAGM